MSKASSPLRAIATWTARLGFSVLIFLFTGEALIRYQAPLPKFQVIRGREGFLDLTVVDGVPRWTHPNEHPSYWNAACVREHPDRPRILFFGSSIFYGSGVAHNEVFTYHLAERYGDRRCVMNLAAPGYTLQTKIGRIQEQLPQNPGAHVVLEIWHNDPYTYTVIGDAVYSLRDAAADREGVPSALGVPAPLNGLLFRNSRLYEYAALALSEPNTIESSLNWREVALPRLNRILTLIEASGGTLSLVFMPALHNDPMPRVEVSRGYPVVIEWARAHNVPWTDAAALLSDQSVFDIRLDPCCHLNAKGHEVLADRIYAELPE